MGLKSAVYNDALSVENKQLKLFIWTEFLSSIFSNREIECLRLKVFLKDCLLSPRRYLANEDNQSLVQAKKYVEHAGILLLLKFFLELKKSKELLMMSKNLQFTNKLFQKRVDFIFRGTEDI